ncbi:Hcp family type VI secretion system effector [Desulfocurvibacter africanus]|uniref:Type VI secretion system effector, Hcp1 family n=2 Tax=Desulfocurvibacter africanus TaxID=873 RepID=F3YX70_DESAF|nr:Hcp family type VI secretion system effector [Desulfocurvibacter africanus]EGJ50568.1 type VI secretion system effector, Hcp1 family [Desulfocurvibacter africanus subsp. africanus str. Walvis Bay]EMG38279.1 type VI secretion system effector, Hcp1 family [Desulfocurvibacter africanus PCS]
MALTSYMTIKGKSQGDIKGDCTQKGREGSIIVYAIDHSVEIPQDPHSGLPTGQRLHKPFIVTKHKDQASPKLFQACCTGEQIEVSIDYYRISEKGQEEKYYTVKMQNAIIVGLKHQKPMTFLEANKPYKDMETVLFGYAKMIQTYVPDGIEAEDSWLTPK